MAEEVVMTPDVVAKPFVTPIEATAIQAFSTETTNKARTVDLFDLTSHIDVAKREAHAEIATEFPDYPDDRFDRMCDLAFGFLQLKPETLLRGQREPDIYEKELSARIQHTYVHHILTASTLEGKTPEEQAYIQTVYTLVRNMETLSALNITYKGKPATSNFAALWGGVKAELALVRTLLQAPADKEGRHWRVFLPNFEQDIADDADMEVLQLDVRNAIDVIAVSPDGDIMLIDAKGRGTDADIEQDFALVRMNDTTNPCVRSVIENVIDTVDQDHEPHPNSRMIQVRTFIPTTADSRVYHPVTNETTDDTSEQRSYLTTVGQQTLPAQTRLTSFLYDMASKYDITETTALSNK